MVLYGGKDKEYSHPISSIKLVFRFLSDAQWTDERTDEFILHDRFLKKSSTTIIISLK